MRLQEKRWVALPDMTCTRAHFFPAFWLGSFYLCGGYDSDGNIDAFHSPSDSMRQLSYNLPDADTGIAVVSVNELVVIANRSLSRFQMTEGTEVETESRWIQQGNIHSSSHWGSLLTVVQTNDQI